MRILRQSRSGRPSFTLIELLLVLSIISILVAMVAGAIVRITANQQQKRTESTVKKIQSALNAQYAGFAADVQRELKNRSAVEGATIGWFNFVTTGASMAGARNPDRANVLWYKLRLTQEFPQNFTEAGLTGVSGTAPQPVFGLAYGSANPLLMPKSAYSAYLTGANTNIGNFLTSGNVNGLNNLEQQSAICLYMVLTQVNRGGTIFNPDDIGAGARGELSYTIPATHTSPGFNLTYTVFVDSWGTPITFERWTIDPLIIGDMAQPPYVSAMATSAGQTDLEDPLNTITAAYLQSPWGKVTNALFQVIPLNPALPSATGVSGQNRGPVVRSAGPDKALFTGDDVLGYRLMVEGQRGN